MSDLCPSPIAVTKVPNAVEDQPQTCQEAHGLLLKKKENCDVRFTFPNHSDRIEAHEIFLKARSPVFKQMFRKRKSGNVRMRVIEISESTPQSFQEFLEFIYMDKFEVNVAGALDLLHLAHTYKVQPLTKKCEELLATEMDVEDSVQVFETARRYDCDQLVDRAGAVMIKSLAYLFEIDALVDAEEGTVTYILERDDLSVKEVNLFKFLVKWGKHQVSPSDEAHLLQDKLQNFIPLIRFTDMTPYELTAVVAPTGLISGEEMLAVHSYIAGDEAMRKDMEMKFNTAPRRVETCVNFYAGDEHGLRQSGLAGSHPLKQQTWFQVQVCKELGQALKKPAITGIKVKWPSRKVTNSKITITDTALSFSVLIVEYYWATKNQRVDSHRFQKNLLNCKNGDEDEIRVDPPVELISGETLVIHVEDQSQHNRSPDDNVNGQVKYTYSGNFSPLDLIPNANVDLGVVDLKVKGIGISGSGHSTQSYSHINVIRGIKISLV